MWLLYGWIGCVVLGYILIRWNRYMDQYGEWTHGDMVKNVLLGIVAGPIYLMVAAMIFFLELGMHCTWNTSGIIVKFRTWWNKKSLL